MEYRDMPRGVENGSSGTHREGRCATARYWNQPSVFRVRAWPDPYSKIWSALAYSKDCIPPMVTGFRDRKSKHWRGAMRKKSNSPNPKEQTRLRPLHEWFQHHQRKGSKIFETYASLKWFVNSEQKFLVDAGVMIPGTKERPPLVTPQFGEEVYQRLYGKD